jgi:hypothetical protein|tara:strand:- start:517 stop:657 length:141 start_codon:yes stop_codon:yes gene_type:complete
MNNQELKNIRLNNINKARRNVLNNNHNFREFWDKIYKLVGLKKWEK